MNQDSVADPLAQAVLDLAKKGDPESQGEAGLGFYFGTKGFPANDEKAIYWAKCAADQGEPWGQYIYAQCLQEGKAIAQNLLAALSWFVMAAQAGNEEAQCMVGTSIFLTQTEQYKWLLLASDSSCEHTAQFARERMAELRASLSEPQMQDASASAHLWRMTRQQGSR